jgi:hypothetical protein
VSASVPTKISNRLRADQRMSPAIISRLRR